MPGACSTQLAAWQQHQLCEAVTLGDTLGMVTCETILGQDEGDQPAGVGAPAGRQRAAERVVRQVQLVKGQLAP